MFNFRGPPHIEIMQGDAYSLPFTITADGETVTRETVENVEFVLDEIHKTLSDGGIEYSAEDEAWLLPLSQEETFSLAPILHIAQVRIKFVDSVVIGKVFFEVNVIRAQSREVL